MKKLDYEQVRSIFSLLGKELLTAKEDYVNTRQILRFRCSSCGLAVETTLSNARKTKSCGRCSERRQRTYEEVVAFFESVGGVVLTSKAEYDGFVGKVHYKCVCGRESVIQTRAFFLGQRCWECGRKKRCGANNPRYATFHIRR